MRFMIIVPANKDSEAGVLPDAEILRAMQKFWLIQAKSKQEAIEWASRAPFGEGVVLEVRQVFEAADFAPVDPTGEHRAKEHELREAVARQKR